MCSASAYSSCRPRSRCRRAAESAPPETATTTVSPASSRSNFWIVWRTLSCRSLIANKKGDARRPSPVCPEPRAPLGFRACTTRCWDAVASPCTRAAPALLQGAASGTWWRRGDSNSRRRGYELPCRCFLPCPPGSLCAFYAGLLVGRKTGVTRCLRLFPGVCAQSVRTPQQRFLELPRSFGLHSRQDVRINLHVERDA